MGTHSFGALVSDRPPGVCIFFFLIPVLVEGINILTFRSGGWVSASSFGAAGVSFGAWGGQFRGTCGQFRRAGRGFGMLQADCY